MDAGLAGKVAWITGASGGIGRALSEHFAREGARLALQARGNRAALERWLAGEPWGEDALVLEADVRDGEALLGCAAAIVERFGRIDACIANAGAWPPEDLLIDQVPEARLRATLETNLLGSLLTARAFFAALRRTGPRPDGHGAALVLVGSTAGRFGERGHADYAAAKAGLVGACLSLKNEIVRLDPHGRVNLVEPGWTVTHMARPALQTPGAVERVVQTMPLRQLGRAADVARACLFLASPLLASHVTGQVLTLAGGMEGRLLWTADELDRLQVLARLQRD
jgi:3-oxoacyl-[acyl-carrier protein] reductase